MAQFRIVGSWGTLTVDTDTGAVLSGAGVAYADIDRFDIEEYTRAYGEPPSGECDILGFGYWTKEASLYIAPDEYHREMTGGGWGGIIANETVGQVLQ